MKKKFLHPVFVVFLFLGTNGLQAQFIPAKVGQICLENTEQFSLTSKYVESETYLIQVSLPNNYDSGNRSYPVLYITDGEIAFEIIKGTADLLMLAREIKEIILVGISYGQGYNVWLKKRSRDLNPANDSVVDKSRDVGGAANFLKFIQFELFPEINDKYRVKPDSIMIEGFSSGGLFNSSILFSQPGLFKGYIINAPPLRRNNKQIFRLENEYFNEHKDLDATVYIAYGSKDTRVSNEYIIDLIQIIQKHNYTGLNLVTRVFEGETHYSLLSAAIAVELKTMFKR